ncbi:carboxypeptidase-like regulatory domain-containing protein [Psychroserpens algicola]|uniref:Carboxypeptidase-like regulatory domain-containing protein n=1 Tax=Psychroserpens algicola TaxID=1719034 RepID=A0ABT0HC98_9FLAO|nr:carboxypeptidase-like regulatory domain-containing protein [Psychroserpens algicola]MCK8481994.1 carboxypeptidase-like regulatory domain-containing protein [Psychroserpens algicola]
MRYLFTILLLVSVSAVSFAQEAETKDSISTQVPTYVKGTVIDLSTDTPIDRVNIVNLNQVIGTSTDDNGDFEIRAQLNDTLHLSYLGFKSIKVRVTNDWLKFGETKIGMTELALALEEVVVNQLKLTGYLEIDVKQVPIKSNYRYSISGLNNGYEAGNRRPNAVSKVLGAIFNPADFLHNMFGKKPRELRRLKKMKQDDEIRNLLASRFDREMLMVLLQVDRYDLDEIVNQCNYSKDFIQSANDLQILDAINECYEEYKVLNRNKSGRF